MPGLKRRSQKSTLHSPLTLSVRQSFVDQKVQSQLGVPTCIWVKNRNNWVLVVPLQLDRFSFSNVDFWKNQVEQFINSSTQPEYRIDFILRTLIRAQNRSPRLPIRTSGPTFPTPSISVLDLIASMMATAIKCYCSRVVLRVQKRAILWTDS